ncbi:DUF418 domain-containing protein [Nocardiopsis sp. CT-R113]|uniref:DUF418 domain-containing protein n=1 Tax=Nocardiopsis codii TaxID=3065942 RepID=A0ABU7KF91_9ACTN|nr:DUF418 domain-containing protein [Nocardiopsis sp. CT-R113]MEE2040877.1 DUF418 domain-containing protein [Nocardiopsis sp. CT-R113]
MSPSPDAARAHTGLDPSRRSLAPDLARGMMLLVIATVHAHLFRQMVTGGDAFTLDDTLDVAVTGFMVLVAESRGYPLFAALFGYGLAQIHRHRTGEGHPWPRVRTLLRRRGRWMLLIGFLHTLLLFQGDIIGVYGLIAVCFVFLLGASDRRLLSHGFAWMAVGGLAYSVLDFVFARLRQETPVLGQEVTLAQELLTRSTGWLPSLVLMVTVSVFPVAVGVWAARRRLLERPEEHLPLLRRVALVGVPVAVLGGVPYLAVVLEVADFGAAAQIGARWLHILSGYAGGFGYAALIALAAVRIGGRRGPVVRALVATGQRSMTCYLLQSVAWAVLFLPFTLDLAGRLSDAASVAVGAGVWLATVVLADLMRRAGLRGPFEVLIRRLTYGRPRREPDSAGLPS